MYSLHSDELVDIIVSMYLVYMSILMPVCTIYSVVAYFNSKERFTVFVCLSSLLLSFQSGLMSVLLMDVVSESTVLPIATSSKLYHIFTKLSFVF